MILRSKMPECLEEMPGIISETQASTQAFDLQVQAEGPPALMIDSDVKTSGQVHQTYMSCNVSEWLSYTTNRRACCWQEHDRQQA